MEEEQLRAMTSSVRDAMQPVCAALAKLAIRLHKMEHSQRRSPEGFIDNHPHWIVAEIQPPSIWLSGFPEKNALASSTAAVLRVQCRLLAALGSGDPIDPLWACRVLQHLGDECAQEYSPVVTRLAARLALELPATPRDMTNCATLRNEFLEGEWLPKSPIRKM
jgi:hypothetical protein